MSKMWKTALLFLSIAGALTLFAGLGVLARADLAVSDALYQQPSATNGELVLVGIDQRALDVLGPYSQWDRSVMARALEALNRSEDCRPAVIGVDVLYAGETQPDLDRQLTEAAERYGNIVTASLAEFGSDLVARDGEYYLDQFAVLSFDQPFDALRRVSQQGHINAMLDKDGILRHHMLFLRLPDGHQVPSLALAAANLYREQQGLEPVEPPPTDRLGFWYLPFCGRPGDLSESISLADLLSGEVPADYFSGKIVLIGPYAAGLQDSYLTAVDHARPMYGVEFQANAILALLREDYRQEVGDGLQLLLLFLLLLASLAGFWQRPVKWAVGLWASLLAGWVLLCRGLYMAGWVLHVLWVPVGVTVLFAGCLALNYIQAALERQRVTGTFKHYVAPEIVNELLSRGPEALQLGGKLTTIAVLFVDVRGFTPMSELLKPEQVVEILNRYLTLISDCILRNGGTLDKFVGDAAMAFWGAPLEQEDFVMRAVQAAADMVEGSRALSQELLEKYNRTVSFGIGIHLGDAVVGNIGSPQRMDYTAIGDTVNTAARLEANAPGGTIYISRAVANALTGRIRTTSLGDTIPLKGKKKGFEVLTMDGILS